MSHTPKCAHDLAENETFLADGFCFVCLLKDYADAKADAERLRAALKPFADALDDQPDYYNDNQRLAAAINGVSLDDFKAARDAMRAQQIIDEAMKVRP